MASVAIEWWPRLPLWPGPLMLLLLRDYATFEYAKFAILERDYAAHY
eukprot:SAG31_NODE_17677_length_661_cov_1.749110_1_plen_46_part_10